MIKSMVVKHCCWGTCNSDRRQKDKEHMKGVTFIPFVKPHIDKEKCERWIRLCYRKEDEFNTNKIDKYTYICSKVFYCFLLVHVNMPNIYIL